MAGFSDRAKAIKPTGIRRMFDLAGDDAIQFGLGEPDFQPPPIAIEAFHRAMMEGRNKYTSTGGLPELRKKSLIHGGISTEILTRQVSV